MNQPDSLPPTVARTLCRLLVAGNSKPLLVVEYPQSITIGRDAQCQVRLNQDPAVSRFHCRMEITPTTIRLLDLGGRNGTFLNDQRITETNVRDGDEVRCGQTRMRVEIVAPIGIVAPAMDDAEATVIGQMNPEAHDYDIPQSLGGYDVVKEIGRGGMGRVLLAVHSTSRKQVAIKIVSPEMAANDMSMSLFVREAAILSRLKHPRIVEVLDFGIQGPWPYLVLEYLPLIDLGELLDKSSPVDRIRVACRVTSLVLEALEHAHVQGFVHRDVKPGNLLAFRDSRNQKLHIKLGDFGLAKSYENAGLSGMTGSREVRGTIVFMPPEQLFNSRSAGPLSDIYSTGATLYRLLAGCNPNEAQHLGDLLAAVFNDDPRPIRSMAAHIPEELAVVVHRAMARDPATRYSSAAQMRDALQVFGQRR